MKTTALRTHMCGDLRETDIGATVSVCGWVGRRREHGEKLAFVDLRDHSGVIQCVVDNDVDVDVFRRWRIFLIWQLAEQMRKNKS